VLIAFIGSADGAEPGGAGGARFNATVYEWMVVGG
jgi:hypothetical protein